MFFRLSPDLGKIKTHKTLHPEEFISLDAPHAHVPRHLREQEPSSSSRAPNYQPANLSVSPEAMGLLLSGHWSKGSVACRVCETERRPKKHPFLSGVYCDHCDQEVSQLSAAVYGPWSKQKAKAAPVSQLSFLHVAEDLSRRSGKKLRVTCVPEHNPKWIIFHLEDYDPDETLWHGAGLGQMIGILETGVKYSDVSKFHHWGRAVCGTYPHADWPLEDIINGTGSYQVGVKTYQAAEEGDQKWQVAVLGLACKQVESTPRGKGTLLQYVGLEPQVVAIAIALVEHPTYVSPGLVTSVESITHPEDVASINLGPDGSAPLGNTLDSIDLFRLYATHTGGASDLFKEGAALLRLEYS